MITAKFGGTAVTPRNLVYLKKIISPFHKVVVVSAVGKEFSSDVKTTDLLEKYFFSGDENIWKAVEDKYRRLTEVNGIGIDVDELLFGAKARARRYGLQYCMSLGEELSAKIVAEYLGAAYVEADEVVRFGVRSLLFKETMSAMSNAYKGVKLAVTGGYYGMGKYGRQTFSRGGSDVTGALCAAATTSSLYENWTDVYGVCVADPVKVYGVSTIRSMSYSEMRALSRGGAEVLHPSAISPAERFSIPIKIGNFYNPQGASTLVSQCYSQNKLLSVTEKRVDDKIKTTILHNMNFAEISAVVSGFFGERYSVINCFGVSINTEKNKTYSCVFSKNKAVLVTESTVIEDLYKYLRRAELIKVD